VEVVSRPGGCHVISLIRIVLLGGRAYIGDARPHFNRLSVYPPASISTYEYRARPRRSV
jgi:hypothetical protein